VVHVTVKQDINSSQAKIFWKGLEKVMQRLDGEYLLYVQDDTRPDQATTSRKCNSVSQMSEKQSPYSTFPFSDVSSMSVLASEFTPHNVGLVDVAFSHAA